LSWILEIVIEYGAPKGDYNKCEDEEKKREKRDQKLRLSKFRAWLGISTRREFGWISVVSNGTTNEIETPGHLQVIQMFFFLFPSWDFCYMVSSTI
jgi:hypothetical protein